MMVHPIIEKICKYVYLFIMSTRLRKRTTAVWTRKTTQICLLSSGLKPVDPMCMICLNKPKTPRDSYWKHILYPIILKKTTFCQLRREHRTSPPSYNVGNKKKSPSLGKVFKVQKIEHFVTRQMSRDFLISSLVLNFTLSTEIMLSFLEGNVILQSELFSLVVWSKRTKAK